jgi:hypothetical protein
MEKEKTKEDIELAHTEFLLLILCVFFGGYNFGVSEVFRKNKKRGCYHPR